MSFFPRLGYSSILNSIHSYCLITCLFFWQVTVAGKDDYGGGYADGYAYGQAIPVTCLNRTIDTGDHITDNLGKLQYIPFLTCNETSLPLSLHYGVSETVTCTITELPDTLYHLLEYYVHSDVPLSCRVPTLPLSTRKNTNNNNNGESKDERGEDGTDDNKNKNNEISVLDGERPYTPLTIAVQGTLQKSHLHIWTDVNVVLHNIGLGSKHNNKKNNKNNKKKKGLGYIVAGTAYSLPEYHDDGSTASSPSSSRDDKYQGKIKIVNDKDILNSARNPWTPGHGTKVVRGEPLTFTFHVGWIEGTEGIHWPFSSLTSTATTSATAASTFFSKLVFFVLAAGVGALVAVYWERSRNNPASAFGAGRRRGVWRGDGILGAPSSTSYSHGNNGGGSGSGYGYGYGGYSASREAGGTGGGYGGYSSGKKD